MFNIWNVAFSFLFICTTFFQNIATKITSESLSLSCSRVINFARLEDNIFNLHPTLKDSLIKGVLSKAATRWPAAQILIEVEEVGVEFFS